MGMFHKVKVGDTVINSIDWEMNPDLSFGTFESWGGRERVRNNDERVYYFFVDGWGDEPKLCLMERGIKHARIMAEIKAPLEIIRKCVSEQGSVARFEQSFAIDEQIREWLIQNVLDDGDASLVVPVLEDTVIENMGSTLPKMTALPAGVSTIRLPAEAAMIQDEEIADIIRHWNFFEAEHNPQGRFENLLVDGGDAGTLVDFRTSLMWQRGGLDIHSLRTITRKIADLNTAGFAGYHDWRIPTLEEAMSLMEPELNDKGVHLRPCFSKDQPFIFVAAQRKPGGYWFVDYKQGRTFWSSGTIPGGFGRLVRTIS
jgi:hypothetical protein